MNKGRMEAFSDGVLAVIITIMVLEMKSPHGATIAALKSVIPVFLSYILSFGNVYWKRQERQDFNRNLCGGNPAGLRAAMDCRSVLCLRCDHVADPRPTYREEAGAIGRCAASFTGGALPLSCLRFPGR